MALKISVSRSYRFITEHDEQFNLGTDIIAKLTLNATTFPTLPHSVLQLTSINNTYLAKINAAKGGDHNAIIARDLYRDNVWLPAIDDTADYVDEVADEDENIILMSGFSPTKSEREDAERPKQMHLEVKSLNAGEMVYKSDTTDIGKGSTYVLVGKTRNIGTIVQDADGHVYVETTGPCKVLFAPVRNKKGTIKGLPSEEKMDFVIFAVNAAGTGPLSAEAKIIIQ